MSPKSWSGLRKLDGKAAEELMPLVYQELRKVAEPSVFFNAGQVTVSARSNIRKSWSQFSRERINRL
jgi:hypothetical protein